MQIIVLISIDIDGLDIYSLVLELTLVQLHFILQEFSTPAAFATLFQQHFFSPPGTLYSWMDRDNSAIIALVSDIVFTITSPPFLVVEWSPLSENTTIH